MGMYRDLIEEGKCDEILGGSVLDIAGSIVLRVSQICRCVPRISASFFEKRSQDLRRRRMSNLRKISKIRGSSSFAAHLVLYLFCERTYFVTYVAIREKNLQSLNRAWISPFLWRILEHENEFGMFCVRVEEISWLRNESRSCVQGEIQLRIHFLSFMRWVIEFWKHTRGN